MPGSLEPKLAELYNEVKNQREALEKEKEERRRDHDVLTRIEEWCKTLFRRVEAQEKIEEERAKEKAKEGAERVKEGRSRWWQVWLVVITALLGSAIGAAITTMVAKLLTR